MPSVAPFQILGFEWVVFILLFVVLAVVLFVVVGVWLYRDANSRGMDGTIWFVILLLASLFASFIGGLVVLIVYLVVREGHPVGGRLYAYGTPPAPMYGYPPYAPYPPPYAPAPPGAPPTVPTGAAPSGTPPPVACGRCGAPVRPGAKFCSSCGSPL